MFHSMIEKAVHKSQHCQRNWDLEKSVPMEDLKVMETAVTQCPSKQNYAYYKPYIITDRATIEAIYDATDGFGNGSTRILEKTGRATRKNSQTLANVLVAFVADSEVMRNPDVRERNALLSREAGEEIEETRKQRLFSIGIAAGYLNLSSSLLGYSTGCCTCFEENKVRDILGADNEVMLLMGVGWKDESRSRREKHDEAEFVFPTFKKNLEAVKIA